MLHRKRVFIQEMEFVALVVIDVFHGARGHT